MNKKQIFLIILALFLTVSFITTNSFAEAPKKHIWEIGTEISHMRYKTIGGGVNFPVLKSDSIMYGVDFSYTYNGALPLISQKINNCMLKIEGKGSLGRVDNDYRWDDTKEHILEFRSLAGYNFSVSNKTIIVPYVGLGYRYLKMNKTGIWHEEKLAHLYNPVGIEINTKLGKRWSIGTKLEYDYFLWGEVHTKDNFIFGDKFDQEKGYGLRGSIKLQKKANKIDLLIEPFLNYWHIKESKASSWIALGPTRTLGGTVYNLGITYPKNCSTEIGIRFAVRF